VQRIEGSAVKEPVLAEMLAWWRDQCANGALPPAAAVDPTRIPRSILPHIAVLEPPDKDGRIRVRLTGTELDREFGTNVSGRYLDEFTSGDLLAYLTSMYAAVISRRLPVYSYGKLRLPNRRLMLAHRLSLPFGQGKVERLVACHAFQSAKAEDAGLYSVNTDGKTVLDHNDFMVAAAS